MKKTRKPTKEKAKTRKKGLTKQEQKPLKHAESISNIVFVQASPVNF